MPNKPVPRKASKTVTEARIVEAAVQLFAQKGFKGTSTKDIARLAKVNEVTLFRYFPNKAKLFSTATSRVSCRFIWEESCKIGLPPMRRCRSLYLCSPGFCWKRYFIRPI